MNFCPVRKLHTPALQTNPLGVQGLLAVELPRCKYAAAGQGLLVVRREASSSVNYATWKASKLCNRKALSKCVLDLLVHRMVANHSHTCTKDLKDKALLLLTSYTSKFAVRRSSRVGNTLFARVQCIG